MSKPKSKVKPKAKPKAKHGYFHDTEAGVEEIMEEIDEHRLSQTSVPKATSLAFWQGIIYALRVRINALGGGE